MISSAGRHITHMDLDAFFVSVEHLRNSKLKGKPLLIGGMSDRGVVASCSYEARKFGIHSGMPMRAALRLCSHAIVIKSDGKTLQPQCVENARQNSPVHRNQVTAHPFDLTNRIS